MPRPRTRTIASAALGSAVARLKRPTTGYWPGTNTCALESAEPLPLASNVPVKQMPLAWLRRWPSAGPPGGASDATNLAGVSRCGESQPAVYAKTTATAPTTAAMIASRATGNGLGKKGDWGMETSFSPFDLVPRRRLRRSRLSVRLHRKDASNPLSVSAYREKLYPISVNFFGCFPDENASRRRREVQRAVEIAD